VGGMEVRQLGPGLWRWTAPHPDWTEAADRPDGWDRMVGCVYLEAPADAREGIVLIDPLSPPAAGGEAGRLWEALDRDVARIGKPVAILLGNHFHQRQAQQFLDRFRSRPDAAVWAPEQAKNLFTCEITRWFKPGDPLPGGLTAHGVEALECPGETVFHAPARRALFCADAFLGAGDGRLRVAPLSWAAKDAASRERYRQDFRRSLRPLGELDIEAVIVSHGEPVLTGGAAAIREALASPGRGES